MSVECYRTKGRNTYYYEGKKVSKRSASSLSPKLPKCISKSKTNMIKSLKKQLKDVLSHREQYKTTSVELDNKLKACSIVREEYDRLVDMIKSANSSVDIMNRICLSKDLKEQIDREYKELRETLESTTRSYDEKVEKLVKIVEKNKLDIETYQSDISSLTKENDGLRESLRENTNIIRGLGEQNSKLQEERIDLIDKVSNLERVIDEKNEQYVSAVNEFQDMNNTLNEENKDLKEYVKELTKEVEKREDSVQILTKRIEGYDRTLEEYIDRYKVDMQKADNEIRVLEEENKDIRSQFDSLGKLYDELDSKFVDLMDKTKECYSNTSRLEREKLSISQQCETDIESLKTMTIDIRKEISREKEVCLMRIQKAIEETEGKISSREARKYEKELADLNYKLLMSEETLEELQKARTLEGEKQNKAMKRAIKKMKKVKS